MPKKIGEFLKIEARFARNVECDLLVILKHCAQCYKWVIEKNQRMFWPVAFILLAEICTLAHFSHTVGIQWTTFCFTTPGLCLSILLVQLFEQRSRATGTGWKDRFQEPKLQCLDWKETAAIRSKSLLTRQSLCSAPCCHTTKPFRFNGKLKKVKSLVSLNFEKTAYNHFLIVILLLL